MKPHSFFAPSQGTSEGGKLSAAALAHIGGAP
jgi:hypothetical protein